MTGESKCPLGPTGRAIANVAREFGIDPWTLALVCVVCLVIVILVGVRLVRLALGPTRRA